ncbi:MAG: TRAP transporter TatT component family protein [Fidelibacterota bacterium]
MKKCSRLIRIVFPLLVLIQNGCIRHSRATTDDSLEKNLQFLIEQGKEHWEKRVDPEEANKARFFLSKAFLIQPDNLEIAALYSRACQFAGYYIETDPVKQDSLFQEGRNSAWSVISRSEPFLQGFQSASGDSTARLLAALENLPIDYIPVLYWWIANSARFLASKPVIERLNHRDEIETGLHRIQALKPDYFYGGPNRIFGGIFARLPGVELALSESYFQQSIKESPNYLGTYVLRARFLHIKAGDREQFNKDLNYVIQADPTALPEVMPENLLEQGIAKALLDQESYLFE